MNISVTRFFMFFILSFILPYSVSSYSSAMIHGGKITWKDVNGYVFVITNTINVINVEPGLPCAGGGCQIRLYSIKDDLILAKLPASATLDEVRNALRVQGQTMLETGPSLCLTIITQKYLQDYPRGCNQNPDAGLPPEEPDPPVTPPLTCYIGSGTINHLVASTKVNLDRAETEVSVNCTGSTNVRVQALNYYPNNGGVTLKGPDTLKSLISIDGISAEQGVVKRVDTYRIFTVRSELRSAAKEVVGGEYSGSLIIAVTTE